MSDITWEPMVTTLGKLKPWSDNPKTTTKREAQLLLNSWKELGQFQTIAIGPGGEVYDGHQRLSALLTVYGPEYQVLALRASRPLEDSERKMIAVQSRQIGSWDWDKLAGWNEGQLKEWGFDADELSSWKSNVANLQEFVGLAYEYAPNTEPTIGAVTHTSEEVEKKKSELELRFAENTEYVEVICPHCVKEFFLRKSDIK